MSGLILAQKSLTTSDATIYGPVQGVNQTVELKAVVFCNESAGAVTVTYGAVRSGGTAGAGTYQCKTYQLGAAGTSTSTLDATELRGMPLGAGDFLSGLASTGAVVTVTVSGEVR